jgi:outer membrane protein assembly factor BamB
VEQTRTPIHLFGFQANSYLVTADGGVHQLNLETGRYEQSWNLDFAPIGEPIKMDGGWIYPSAGDELVAVADDHRTILWRKSGITAFTNGIATASLMGFVSADNQLWMLSSKGDVVHRADLRSGARFAGGAGGGLIAYTWGGLWNISSGAEWSLIANHPAITDDGRGVMRDDDGRIFITTRDTLQIYAPTGELTSQLSLSQPLMGQVSLARYNTVIFIMSSEGMLLALREDGLVCGELRVTGDVHNPHHWQAMGTDDILRLRVGNLTMGLNWDEFIEGC